MKKFLLMFVAVSTMFVGCKKDEKTGVKIVVSAPGYNSKVSNVEVSLYKTLEDAQFEKNEVAKGITNNEGEVVIEGLEEREYYIRGKGADCFTNDIDLVNNKGEESKIIAKTGIFGFGSIIIDETSKIMVHNRTGAGIRVELSSDAFFKSEVFYDKILLAIDMSVARVGSSIHNGKLRIYVEPTTSHNIEVDLGDISCNGTPKDIYIEP